jgi:hypothetical protein
MKNCFYCGEEILQREGKIFPLDKPYVNIWVHRAICFDAMHNEEYLQENYQRILDYTGTSGITKTKDKVKRK